MSYQTVFTAYLDANKVFIDLNFLPSTVTYTFMLTIKNQTPQTLYFKVVLNIPNWSISSPSGGALGSVSAGSSANFTVTISRANPNAETVDSGTMVVEAYTDSNYTNKVGSASLPVTITFENTEAWTNVMIDNFDDGTSQGWSGGTVTSGLSIEAGGYSYQTPEVSGATTEKSISKSVTLPTGSKARITFYFVLKARNVYSSTLTAYLNYIKLLVNDTEVSRMGTVISLSVAGNTTVYTSPWYKVTFDLTPYVGQTITIALVFGFNVPYNFYLSAFVDRIVIAVT